MIDKTTNIRNISFDPDKNKYTVVVYNGTAKTITREEFLEIETRRRHEIIN